MNYYDRQRMAERLGDPVGRAREERRCMTRLGEIEGVARARSLNTVDQSRLFVASVVSQVVDGFKRGRGDALELAEFCDRLLRECGNPEVAR